MVTNTRTASFKPVYLTIPLYVFRDKKIRVFIKVVINNILKSCFGLTDDNSNFFSIRMEIKTEGNVHTRSRRKMNQRGTILMRCMTFIDLREELKMLILCVNC